MSDSGPIRAALAALIILQLVMLGALYAGVAPHPPSAIPLFGVAPFLATALATAAAALILDPLHGIASKGLSVMAAAMAMLSFGPQKYLDPEFPLIWPAVLAAQIAAAAIVVLILRPRAGRDHG